MTPIDIRADHLGIVQAVLRRHLPGGVKVWVFGSRATWMTKDSSDLDLALEGDREVPPRSLSALEVAFEESDLPFAVDIVDIKRIGERFRRIVERQRLRLTDGEGSHATDRCTGGGRICRDWPEMVFTEAFQINPPIKIDRGSSCAFVDMATVDPSLRSVRASGVREFRGGGSRFQDGDVLMARITPCLENGKVARYYADGSLDPAHGSTEFIVVRGRPGTTDTEFAFYMTRSSVVRDYAIGQMTGTSGRQRVPTESLDHLTIAVPSIPEQCAIARILGTLDDKIELNRRMNVTLEALARALFRSWFVDFDPVRAKMEGRGTGLPNDIADLFPDRLVDSELGEIPEGWCASTLADIARLNPESWSNDNAPDRILYVDLAKTKWGYIDDIRMYSWANAPSRGRRVLRRGDTIVGTVRPGNGSFALIDRDGLTGSTGFAVLRPTDPIEREIVWCAATSHDAIDRLAHLADGGAYPAVNPKAVLDTVVILPDTHIRLVFSSLAAPLVNRLQQNQREARTVGTIRDALLPKLVSGELRAPLADRQRGERPNG